VIPGVEKPLCIGWVDSVTKSAARRD